MASTKIKIGSLIDLCLDKNGTQYGLDSVKGISIQKKFIDTKADMDGVSLKPYLLVRPNWFCYVPVTSRNGEKISIAMNDCLETYIVSSSYVVFKVKDTKVVLPEYLFMYFNRPEFDRFSRFNSWGSARETFDFDELCDIEIELPPIEVQQKYVTIYNNITQMRNRLAKEKELLEKVCSIEIEKLLKTKEAISLSKIVELNTLSNDALTYGINDVYGVSQDKTIIPTKAKPKEDDLKSFTVITKNDFVYNPRNGVAVALNRNFEGIISFNNTSFRVNKEYSDKYLPEYIFMFLKRPEWDRKVKFLSWGSSTEVFSFDALGETEIPVISYETQFSLSRIHNEAENKRERVLALDTLLKKLCPVLIKASIS